MIIFLSLIVSLYILTSLAPLLAESVAAEAGIVLPE